MKRIYLFSGIIFFFFICCSMQQCGDEELCPLTEIEVVNLNNEMDEPFVSDDSIKKEAYAFQVFFIGQFSGMVDPYKSCAIENFTRNTVNYTITTNTDFDDSHTIGDDVTDYFSLYNKEAGNGHTCTIFVLRKAPNPGVYSFRITASLDTRTFVVSTTPVVLY